jgi:hypothetical protein
MPPVVLAKLVHRETAWKKVAIEYDVLADLVRAGWRKVS